MTEIFTDSPQHLYVVVTQTGTILSRILKIITGAQYNHVSVTVDPTLDILYSFGRKNPYNPFFGGMVKESPHFGTFKRFHETEAVVLRIPVSALQKEYITQRLEYMYEHRTDYHYNVLGLLLAAIRVHHQPQGHYYCSEFVRYVLEDSGVVEQGHIAEIPKPMEFLDLPGDVTYRGKLRLYSQQ